MQEILMVKATQSPELNYNKHLPSITYKVNKGKLSSQNNSRPLGVRPLEERRVGGSGGCSLVGDPLLWVVGGADACSVGPFPTSTVSGAPTECSCYQCHIPTMLIVK